MAARNLNKHSASTRVQSDQALQRAIDEQMERLRERPADRRSEEQSSQIGTGRATS